MRRDGLVRPTVGFVYSDRAHDFGGPVLSKLTALLSLASLVLVGCDKKPSPPHSAKADLPADSTSGMPVSDRLQRWQGTWFGPEGTHLKLTLKPDSRFEILIRDLDQERAFEGVARADHIEFTRDGQTERIRATDGAGTGMKWLADKVDCLTVKQSEGYCRD